MRSKPKKSLGQNFLIDKNIQEKIISACSLTKNNTVLEIGPGRGEITSYLIGNVKRLIAVEVDRDLCETLRQRFSGAAFMRPAKPVSVYARPGLFNGRNFELINQDILKVDLSALYHPAPTPGTKVKAGLKVIANVPYYISTPIIEYLLNNRKLISVIYLTLQKELALRLLAEAGSKDYSAFSCFVQYYTKPKLLFSIKKNSFWPPPKVDSCFLEMKMLPKPSVKVRDEEFFFKVVRSAFNQRRKAIKNSLARVFAQSKIIESLKALKLGPNSRAEDLTLKDFADLSDIIAV